MTTPTPDAADPPGALPDFSSLDPQRVIALVEDTLGRPATSMCRSLTSYINRVYEVRMADDSWVIAKFYRPGRWSLDALQDEHDFLCELRDAEVPVIAPLPAADAPDATLHLQDGLAYALFPKRGGRPLDEPLAEQWAELGRLLARVHTVGAQHPPVDRITIGPGDSAAGHLEYILTSNVLPPEWRRPYENAAVAVLDCIAPLFDDTEELRIHGDLHGANLLSRPGEPLFLIDFDDMAVGPPVQDLWMLLPGYARACQREIDLLLDGYCQMRDFDFTSLRLIEPLRALRFLHFTAWCARQKADGGFTRLAPNWGSGAWWRQEVEDLQNQLAEIESTLESQ